VLHQAGLWHYRAAHGENHEVRDAADLEAACDLRVLLRIHFNTVALPAMSAAVRDFGSNGDARPAPSCPEVHEHRHSGVLHDFIESLIVQRDWLSNGRQDRFSETATARAGQKFGWNAVLLSAVRAGANDRQAKPPLVLFRG
jgi:hypothetical protein